MGKSSLVSHSTIEAIFNKLRKFANSCLKKLKETKFIGTGD